MATEATTGSEAEQVIPAIPPPAPKEESSPTDVVLRVLGAIGTGIGILGFVTFFGGAILWVRADKAELPATEAVAAIPRNVLISTGAQFLFPALLYAVGLVTLVFLVYFGFKAFEILKSRQERGEITKCSLEAADLGRKALVKQQEWKTAAAFLDALRDDLAEAHERQKTGTEISALERKLKDQQRKATELQAEAEKAISEAAQTKADLDTRTEKAAAKLERETGQWIAEISAAFVALALVVYIDGSIARVSHGQGLVLFVLAVVGAILVISVYWATENFVWFGVMAFVVVGVYLGAATYFNTHNNAKMEPVAVLRAGHEPIAAAFIAGTSENLYVGTFREKKTPPRLLVIPRSQVVELTVGPLLEQRPARHRALAMALNECAQTIKEPAAAQPTSPMPPAEAPTSGTQGGNSEKQTETDEKQAGYAAACTPPQEEKLEVALHRRPKTGQLDQPG
jgi:hypothetical protein